MELTPQPTYRSFTLPTPGIEKLPNYYVIQQLIVERLKTTLDGTSFDLNFTYELVSKYLTVPPHYQTQEQIEAFLRAEAQATMAAFQQYEMDPHYQEALMTLKPYEGHAFQVTSVTMGNVILIIQIPPA